MPSKHCSKMGPMMSRRFRLALLLLLLLGVLLRLQHLDVQSLWYDEGVTARVSQMSVTELARWTANDIQPPLYYLLLGGWLQLFDPWPGNIAYLMRFLSVAFGALLIPLLGIMARKLWDDCAGLLAAFVAAISPLMVYYSQEARMYAMLIFLVTLAAWWVAALLEHSSHSWTRNRAERKRLLYLALYALTGLAAMYTHYFAGFALLALALYWAHVWVRENHNPRALAGFVLANSVILLGYLPWLPAMLRRFQTDSSYWPGLLKPGEALMHAADNFTVGATEVFREEAALRLLPGFGLAAFLWLIALAAVKRRGGQRPLALILHWLLLPPAFILLLAYHAPKFNPRYLLISWPAWALLIGGGSAALWRPERWLQALPVWLRPTARILAVGTLLLVTTTSALGLDNWRNDPNFAKSSWREAIAYMFEHRQPDEAALLVSGHAFPVFDTYLPPDAPPPWQVPRYRLPDIEILDVTQVLGWQESARALNQDLADYGGVWLFLWQDDVVDPAHVVTTQLGRYARELPVPPFAFLGLRHYRLPDDFHAPEQPPVTLPGTTFGDGLELVGLEPAAGGLWLYWQATRPHLPDIKVAIGIEKEGQQLFSSTQRPMGYDFPTTHWNQGDIYPAWLPVDSNPSGATLRIRAYIHTHGAPPLGQFEMTLP